MLYLGPTLALYCLRCGRIETSDLHCFGMKSKTLTCTCGEQQADVTATRHHQYLLSVFCSICETKHILCLEEKPNSQEPIKLYCPHENVEIGFIGRRDAVEKLLLQHKCEYEQVCELEDTVEDPQIMFEIINRVHDIAAKDNLYCQCGSSLIRAEVGSDGVDLYCMECGGHLYLQAKLEKDLEFINACQELELVPTVLKHKKPGG